MKKRLFITTGLISLMSALTIIKMGEASCEDHMIVYSFSLDEDFIEKHRLVCRCHDFEKLYFAKDWREAGVNFDIFDEVYAVERVAFCDTACFAGKKLFYFDESIAYLNQSINNINNPDGTFYWDYLHKIVPCNHVKNTVPDADIFRSIAKTMTDEKITIHTPCKKRALLLGQDLWESVYPNGSRIEYYKKIILDLKNKNFDVYIKPHPREDKNTYDALTEIFPEGLYFIKTSFPVELYEAEFTLAVSPISTSLFSLAHLRNIPTGHATNSRFFSNKIPFTGIQFSLVVIEYIPGYEYLLKFIDYSMTHKEAVEVLRNVFFAYIKDKQSTNNNITVKKVFRAQIKTSRIVRTYINLISIFIFDKKKRKNFRNEKIAELSNITDPLLKTTYTSKDFLNTIFK